MWAVTWRDSSRAGVYASTSPSERLAFHPTEPLTDRDVVEVLALLHHRGLRYLTRCGRQRREAEEVEPEGAAPRRRLCSSARVRTGLCSTPERAGRAGGANRGRQIRGLRASRRQNRRKFLRQEGYARSRARGTKSVLGRGGARRRAGAGSVGRPRVPPGPRGHDGQLAARGSPVDGSDLLASLRALLAQRGSRSGPRRARAGGRVARLDRAFPAALDTQGSKPGRRGVSPRRPTRSRHLRAMSSAARPGLGACETSGSGSFPRNPRSTSKAACGGSTSIEASCGRLRPSANEGLELRPLEDLCSLEALT